MYHPFLKTLIFLLIFVIAGILVDKYFLGRNINSLSTAIIQKPVAYVFSAIENAGFFSRGLLKLKNIITENEHLKKENFILLSKIANSEDLKSENDFLKKALNISTRLNSEVAYANIYYFQLGLDGYDALLNKGANDGINEEDIIISEAGILIGRVEMVYPKFSRILVVNDPDFNVTARVLNSNTSGIVKGALDQGLYFDLIIQSDLIKEGDVVVSSGIDLILPNLIIGTVSHVETEDTELFKKVKIKPAMGEIKIGRVLVIKAKSQ